MRNSLSALVIVFVVVLPNDKQDDETKWMVEGNQIVVGDAEVFKAPKPIVERPTFSFKVTALITAATAILLLVSFIQVMWAAVKRLFVK